VVGDVVQSFRMIGLVNGHASAFSSSTAIEPSCAMRSRRTLSAAFSVLNGHGP
jgi:hypothetical protein